MKYVEALLKNETYLNEVAVLKEYEAERVYCKHTFEHFLDVCRIAYIMNLENGFEIPKETIYLCGLLHDIGRAEEYRSGVSHEEAGVKIASSILDEIDYPKELKQTILDEIGNHRTKPEDMNKVTKESLFYLADKKARNCFLCPEAESCNWSEDKKTKTIYC